MDILISSNLERLLYHETNDPTKVKKLMEELNETGKYRIENGLKRKLEKIFYATFTNEEETKETIKTTFNKYRYLPDTHTAVAISAANKYRSETNDMRPMIIASTASPYKFAPAVLTALGENIDKLDEFEQLSKLNKITSMNIPQNLADLKSAPVLHNDVCEKVEMTDRVLKFARDSK